MKYRPEIDGLRTVAVLPVIFFHGGFPFFSGGFVGVDVFFVISGYLITTILLSEFDTGSYSLLRFYERRARRILPALFLVMACCIPFAFMWMHQTQLKDFFESLTTTALFASNFLFWSESGYFAAVAEEKPLLHTWSLAIEEQYYLLFPPVLWLAMKAGRHAALALILVCGIASICFAQFGDLEPEGRFFLTHARVWELLIGSACAWVLLYHPPHAHQGAAILGLILIVGPIFVFSHDTPYPAFAILPVAGTALLILFAGPGTIAAQLLSLRPMVAIGLISFSAYLWHQPLFAFARITSIGPPSIWLMAGLAAASLVLAAATWAWVEQPFRGKPARFLPRRGMLLTASTAGVLGFAILGWYGHEQEGFPERAIIRSLKEPMIDARFERFRTWDVLDGVIPARFDLSEFSKSPDTTKVLLLGDSHSKGLFNAFYQNESSFPGLEFRWHPLNFGCFAESEKLSEQCLAELENGAPELFASASHVLIAARWHRPGRLPALDVVPQAMKLRGIEPVIVGQTMEYETEGPVLIADIARAVTYDGNTLFPIEKANRVFFEERSELALATHKEVQNLAVRLGLPFLDRQALICDELLEQCTGVTPEGFAVTYDYGHWTLAGAAHFGRVMASRGWLQLP